jgi:malate/lactate dehydrogenase
MQVPVTAVKNVIIWGNHSSTQYPDVNHAVVNGKPVREAVNDNEWYVILFAIWVKMSMYVG